MNFGLFYEHQLPRPWSDNSEQILYNQILDEIELADKIGIDYLWVAEHHHLEEYAHISAPEVFLGAVSQRTKRIRIGHGVMIMLPPYNATIRCAERIATLDILSGGRVEWGTGESASLMELGAFNIDLNEKKKMWREATEQAANMLSMQPYPGYQGTHVQVPCRNIVPKSVQKPHPPLWLACTRKESILEAARLGMGALTFSFIDMGSADELVKEYYRIIKSEECVPIGNSVNPNFAMVTGFSCNQDKEVARNNVMDGLKFFSYGLMHYYLAGEHQPGVTSLWDNFNKAKGALSAKELSKSMGIGTPSEIKANFENVFSTGVDQVILIQQAGKISHEVITDSLNLFGKDVLPHFKDKQKKEMAKKQEELAPYIKAALNRKVKMEPLAPANVPKFASLGGVGDLKVKK